MTRVDTHYRVSLRNGRLLKNSSILAKDGQKEATKFSLG